jgi:hypothetical protein
VHGVLTPADKVVSLHSLQIVGAWFPVLPCASKLVDLPEFPLKADPLLVSIRYGGHLLLSLAGVLIKTVKVVDDANCLSFVFEVM